MTSRVAPVSRPVRFSPLGDQAILAYFADEAAAVPFANAVRALNPPWLQDVVPAYCSVGVFFDADVIRANDVIRFLASRPASAAGVVTART